MSHVYIITTRYFPDDGYRNPEASLFAPSKRQAHQTKVMPELWQSLEFMQNGQLQLPCRNSKQWSKSLQTFYRVKGSQVFGFHHLPSDLSDDGGIVRQYYVLYCLKEVQAVIGKVSQVTFILHARTELAMLANDVQLTSERVQSDLKWVLDENPNITFRVFGYKHTGANGIFARMADFPHGTAPAEALLEERLKVCEEIGL